MQRMLAPETPPGVSPHFEDGVAGQSLPTVNVRRNTITRYIWTHLYDGDFAIVHVENNGMVLSGFTIADNAITAGKQTGAGGAYGPYFIFFDSTDGGSNFTVSGNTCAVTKDGPQMSFRSIATIALTDNVFTPTAGGAADSIARLLNCSGITESGNTPSGTV